MSQEINKVYWMYDIKNDEFFMDITAKEINEITNNNIKPYHVYVLAANKTVAKGRWIIWFATESNTPAMFKAYFSLPPKLKMDALESVRKEWGAKIYDAYWKKYRYPKQIVLLGKDGEEVGYFDSYQECADELNIPIGTVRSKLHRALTLKITKPIICKREDYDSVLQKYYTSSIKIMSKSFKVAKTLNIGWAEQKRSSNTWDIATLKM